MIYGLVGLMMIFSQNNQQEIKPIQTYWLISSVQK